MVMYAFPLTTKDLKENRLVAESAEYAIQNKSKWVNINGAREELMGTWERESMRLYIDGVTYAVRKDYFLIKDNARVFVCTPVSGVTGKEIPPNAGQGLWQPKQTSSGKK